MVPCVLYSLGGAHSCYLLRYGLQPIHDRRIPPHGLQKLYRLSSESPVLQGGECALPVPYELNSVRDVRSQRTVLKCNVC